MTAAQSGVSCNAQTPRWTVWRRACVKACATRAEVYADFIAVLEQDARATRAALRLVLAQQAMSSQLIDNLNASIHIRALLTDIFLIDETLKARESRWLMQHGPGWA